MHNRIYSILIDEADMQTRNPISYRLHNLVLCLLLAFAYCHAPLAVAQPVVATPTRLFQAGAATVDITPTSERSIIAGGFLESQSAKINDRLYVRSMVLDDGATKITLTVVDTCMMTQSLIDEAKLIASQNCGIPVNHMMISATHTHSAPAAMACLGTRQDKEYAAWLPSKIAEAIVSANAKLVPARIGWASIDDWEHTHNRRWIRKPEKKVVDPFGQSTGLAHMHPGYQSKDVIGPSGPVDPELSIISVQSREGRPLAVLANYSQHYFGAQAISADYYGLFCKYVASLLQEPGEGNGPFVCAMSQGTSGDLMWMDYGSPAKKSLTAASYAEAVARYAEQALDRIEYRDFAPLAIVEKTLPLKYRAPDANRLAWAQPIADRIENGLAKNLQEVYANEALILHQRQSTTLKLQAIQIGDLTIATLPNEVYALTGLKLKGRSPLESHFNIELANGAEGYIPPPEQHALGGYTTWPARTAGLEVDAETKIVNTLVDAMEEATGRQRQTMRDQHGPYATSVLGSNPLGYWRLDDEDGTTARNAINGGQRAQLTPGYAWYLPGVGSGTGIGERESLTLSSFSGSNQINRAVHLAGGNIAVDAKRDLDAYSCAFWFWLGEPSGASERSGKLCVGLASEELIAEQFSDHTVRLLLNGKSSDMKWDAEDWHFVTLVREKGQVKVFIDGSPEAAVQSEVTSQVTNRQFQFGNGLQGKLDEIAIFDHALTVSEIESWWNISGMAQQHRRKKAERRHAANVEAIATQAPAFPNTYRQAIQALQPIVFETLDSAPKEMTISGSVAFTRESYAGFASGRLAWESDKVGDTFSLSLWFQNHLQNDLRPVTAYLFSRGPDADDQAPGDHLGIGGTYQRDLTGRLILFNGNQKNQVVAGRSVIPARTWNHLVLLRSKNRVRIFLNGDKSADLDADIDVTAEGFRNFFLGARCDQFAPLQGQLAFMAMFDRELSADEVQLLYSASGQTAGIQAGGKAEPIQPASPPLSPEESLSRIHVPSGFRVELVAAEPEVIDPVAFDWDASGRLWVVEMSDYPLGIDGNGKPGGRVRVLEDRDGDGRYEISTLFADGLNFPNGILTWRDGVLITAAPQILFLRDTDGDGQADEREVLFDGFNEGNQQLRMNGLRWGLDNWVYCANGGHHANHGLGTKVHSARNGQSYEIGSRDFRFQPDTGALVTESGPSQFGRNRDAWGHWFGTQNAKPLWNYVIADRYLSRNPFVPSPNPIQFVLPPNSPEVYPASRPEKRFHSFKESGHFTSACGGMIYGDQRLFGPSPYLHAFTCEPFHNLIQHNLVSDAGFSFTSKRPVGEGVYDFFASEDRWCRPVMARTGPDGGLWIADMYRYMIEHPQWLPPEGKQELLPHYRLGDDRGRIYRIVPEGTLSSSLKTQPLRDMASTLAAMDSTNDWQRDKAQQILVWGKDLSAVPRLEKLAQSSALPQVRLQALATLDGLGALSTPMIVAALVDMHPRVRENGIRLAESRNAPESKAAAIALTIDADEKVCLQLALTLGEWPEEEAGIALVDLAKRFYDQPWMRSAIMSSALKHAVVFAKGVSRSQPHIESAFRDAILRQSVGRKDLDIIGLLLSDALASEDETRIYKMDALLWTLQQLGTSLEDLMRDDPRNALSPIRGRLDAIMLELQSTAGDEMRSVAERMKAARVLCRSNLHRETGVEILSKWLSPQIASDDQRRVLEILMQSGHERVPTILANVWSELSPELRKHAIEVWLSRTPWANDLLDRVSQNQIHVGSLELSQRERLRGYPEKSIAERAKILMNDATKSPRRQVVDEHRRALDLKSDATKGAAVFSRVCASCHRREATGFEVGPNLATVVKHTPEKLLIGILDPNVDIQPGYQAYNVLMESGEVLSGILTGETANSISLKQANGLSRTISRIEIEKLRNSNISFMPEGLESVLSHQDVADLIAFLQQPIPSK